MTKITSQVTSHLTFRSTRWVTFHTQKSKLITLGTAVHKFLDCPCLKRTNAKKIDISGCSELVNSIAKCSFCFDRKD